MNLEFSDEIRAVEKQLDSLGVPKELAGYKYIKTAVLLLLMDFSLVSSMTKVIYPEVGKCYNKSKTRVEIEIRTALRSAWNKDPEYFKEFFNHPNWKKPPMIGEFIAELAEKIRLNSKK